MIILSSGTKESKIKAHLDTMRTKATLYGAAIGISAILPLELHYRDFRLAATSATAAAVMFVAGKLRDPKPIETIKKEITDLLRN